MKLVTNRVFDMDSLGDKSERKRQEEQNDGAVNQNERHSISEIIFLPLKSNSLYRFPTSYQMPCICVFCFFLLSGSYERWESRGHSDRKSKKCGPLRRGLLAYFCREGKTLIQPIACIRWKKPSGPVGLVKNKQTNKGLCTQPMASFL